MLTEHQFQERASEALEDLETKLTPIAEREEFEIESGSGMITIIFEEPSAAKFIISPNSPARQIWVSALLSSHKFGYDDNEKTFVSDKTGEPLHRVIASLISKHTGKNITF